MTLSFPIIKCLQIKYNFIWNIKYLTRSFPWQVSASGWNECSTCFGKLKQAGPCLTIHFIGKNFCSYEKCLQLPRKLYYLYVLEQWPKAWHELCCENLPSFGLHLWPMKNKRKKEKASMLLATRVWQLPSPKLHLLLAWTEVAN